MKENLENRITLNDIAQFAGYSCSHLTTLFSQKMSHSPMEYYNRLRILKACSYLQFSEMKIKEIAFQLGFYDPFHFSKAFLKEMEVTPSEYRRRYREIHRDDKSCNENDSPSSE
jgi:transcriptional regulator GlxA family with amidase domain